MTQRKEPQAPGAASGGRRLGGSSRQRPGATRPPSGPSCSVATALRCTLSGGPGVALQGCRRHRAPAQSQKVPGTRAARNPPWATPGHTHPKQGVRWPPARAPAAVPMSVSKSGRAPERSLCSLGGPPRPPAGSGLGLRNLKWEPCPHSENAGWCRCARPRPRTDGAQRLQEAPGAPSPWSGLMGQTQKDLTVDGQPARDTALQTGGLTSHRGHQAHLMTGRSPHPAPRGSRNGPLSGHSADPPHRAHWDFFPPIPGSNPPGRHSPGLRESGVSSRGRPCQRVARGPIPG